MNFNKMDTKTLKQKYCNALDEFLPLREKELDNETEISPFIEEEVIKYVHLIEDILLPIIGVLFERNENKFLNDNSFDYEL